MGGQKHQTSAPLEKKKACSATHCRCSDEFTQLGVAQLHQLSPEEAFALKLLQCNLVHVWKLAQGTSAAGHTHTSHTIKAKTALFKGEQ